MGAPLAAIAVLAAGCGGSSSGGGATDAVTPAASTSSASPGQAVAIGVSDGHLVDGSGRTLYLFEADKSTTSTCSGACATAWPPVTTEGAPTAASGAKASLLGTSKRDDGTTQVTYAGHPLYLFSGDSAPGDTNGAGSEAFGAEWYPVTPAGDTQEDESGSSSSDKSNNDSSSSGYSYSSSY